MDKYLPTKFWAQYQAISHSESGLITEHPCEMDIYPLQDETEVQQVRLHSGDHAAHKIAKQNYQPYSSWSGKASTLGFYQILSLTYDISDINFERLQWNKHCETTVGLKKKLGELPVYGLKGLRTQEFSELNNCSKTFSVMDPELCW